MKNTVTLIAFERIMEDITEAVDHDCEIIMQASPKPVQFYDGLDEDLAVRAIALLEESYPDRFQFTRGKDGLYAQFI